MNTEYICRNHTDQRGHRLFDLFPEMTNAGQINIQYFFDPKLVTCWHSHKHTEAFCCIKGSFKFGVVKNREATEEELKNSCTLYGLTPQKIIQYVHWDYLSDKNPGRIIKINSMEAHGFRCLEPNSILLYYISEKYNIEHIIREPLTKYCTLEDWFNNGE